MFVKFTYKQCDESIWLAKVKAPAVYLNRLSVELKQEIFFLDSVKQRLRDQFVQARKGRAFQEGLQNVRFIGIFLTQSLFRIMLESHCQSTAVCNVYWCFII